VLVGRVPSRGALLAFPSECEISRLADHRLPSANPPSWLVKARSDCSPSHESQAPGSPLTLTLSPEARESRKTNHLQCTECSPCG